MSSSSPAPESWISSFCSLLGHEYFAEVSEDFIEDDFNLTGLQSLVPMYKEALEMILDVEPEEDEEDDEEEEEEEEDDDDLGLGGQNGGGAAGGAGGGAGFRRGGERRHTRTSSDLSMVENSAEMLYGLIHQRYITSRPGIQQMTEKYDLQHFGVCPRVACNGCRVLPVGSSDMPGVDTVKLFCPACLDIYTPPNSRFQSVDGAYFGTTFGCLFFMTFPDLHVAAKPDAFHFPPYSSTVAVEPGTRLPTKEEEAEAAKQPATINGMATQNLAPGLGKDRIYEPRIYGFRVSERARSGPRMRWLRSKPEDVKELDEVRVWKLMNNDWSSEGYGEDEDEDEEDDDDDEVPDVQAALPLNQQNPGEGDGVAQDGAIVQVETSNRRRKHPAKDRSASGRKASGRRKDATAVVVPETASPIREASPMDTNGLGGGL